MADKNVLLVEGKDDGYVLKALFNHHGISGVCTIRDKQGITKLLDELDVELLASGLERIGIVVDADINAAARWQSLRYILEHRSGYSAVPTAPDPNGTVITEQGKPIVGIWLMPDNTLPGMLEDFIRFLVPTGDTLWIRSGDCIDSIPQPERLFPDAHRIKAHVHTWLAWQQEPGKPLGLAITFRYLHAEATHARMLVAWVRRLFGLTP